MTANITEEEEAARDEVTTASALLYAQARRYCLSWERPQEWEALMAEGNQFGVTDLAADLIEAAERVDQAFRRLHAFHLGEDDR